MAQEISGVVTLNLEQTTQQLTSLGEQLRVGNFTGSGKLRGGIRGDIENVFGWQGKSSPETPLTDQDRVTWLEKFREEATAGKEATGAPSSLVNWIDGRIEEIKETEVEKWMKARSQNPQPINNESVQTLLDQFELAGREYGEIETRRFEDTHPMMVGRGKSYSPEDEARMRELSVQRKNIKIGLYDILFKRE